MEIPTVDCYKPYNEMIKSINPNNIFNQTMLPKSFDFDFEEYTYKNFNKEKLKAIKMQIRKYHNIVAIDYEYFFTIVKEKFDLYHPYYFFTPEKLDLSIIPEIFKDLIPYDTFEKYCLCIIKKEDNNKFLLEYNFESFINKYPNVFWIEHSDFNAVLFELIKNYYINDDFFHLDKFVVISDNLETGNMLLNILPKYNYAQRHPDFFLVRNLNFESHMPAGLRYVVADIFVSALMGLSPNEMGLLEAISYNEIEISLDEIPNLPFNQKSR